MAKRVSAESFVNTPNRRNGKFLSPLTLGLILGGIGLILASAYVIGATRYGIYAFGAVLGLAFALSIVLQPVTGVYVLFAFVYLNLSDILTTQFGLPDSNKILFVLVLVGFVANRIVIHHKPIIFRKTEVSILAFGMAMMLSTFIAGDRAIAANELLDWIKDFAILFLVVQLCSEELIWKRSQWILIWMALLLSGLSSFQVLTDNYEITFGGLALSPVHQIVGEFDSARVSGPIGDPNFYAQILLMALPLAVYRLLDTNETVELRLLGGLSSAFIAATIIFTYSRAAFATLIIIGLLVALERRINIYKIAIIGLAIILVFLPFLPESYVSRLQTLQDILPGIGTSSQQQTELSFRGRTSEMIVAGQIFADHPVLGVGPGNYTVNYLDYSSQLGLDNRYENREAHSLYLEIAAEQGTLGIITFVLLLVVVFLGTRRAKKLARSIDRADLIPWISAVQLGVTAYLMTSIFLHGDFMRYFWLIIALAASSSAVLEQLIAKQTQRNTF